MQEDQDGRRQLAEQWVDAQRALSPLATLRVHSQQGECAVIISRSTFGEICAEIAFTALHCTAIAVARSVSASRLWHSEASVRLSIRGSLVFASSLPERRMASRQFTRRGVMTRRQVGRTRRSRSASSIPLGIDHDAGSCQSTSLSGHGSGQVRGHRRPPR